MKLTALILAFAMLGAPAVFAAPKSEAALATETLNAKVNKILETLDKMQIQLEQIRKELEVVKVRATR